MATYARWNRTIQDGAGNALNATVTVYKESDGLLATIYSDRTGTSKANPFTLSSSDQGLAFFHAAGGAYKVVATYGSYTQTWRYEPVGTGAEFDADSLAGIQPPTSSVAAAALLAEATANGSNKITLTVPASLSADYTITLPAADVTMSTYAATLLDDANAAAARTTLGLGTSAVIDTGTSGTKVALTDGANTWSAAQTLSAALNLTSGQIAFPATQAASSDANTLDDYEEGTFTPAFSATGCTFSYASQTGVYVKVGSLVWFMIKIALNTSGNTLVGNALSITGMPFAFANVSNQVQIYLASWFGATSSYYQLSFSANTNQTTMACQGMTAAATSSLTTQNANQALHATNGSTIYVTGCYTI